MSKIVNSYDFFFFSSRRRHTRFDCDWSSDVCSSDLEQLDGIVHVDYRQRRGVGAGPDFNYHLGRWGEGTFRYYYLHDDDPNAGGLTNASLLDNRQRLYFSYQAAPATNLEIKALARYQSDIGVLRDFFEGEYRETPQPNSFFDAHKFWQNFSREAYAQP